MTQSTRTGVGLNNVGSYQVAGKPFVTGAVTAPGTGAEPVRIKFPSVTNWFTITTDSNQHVRFGFSALGVTGSNYFVVHEESHPTQQGPYHIKATELYILSDTNTDATVYVMAGLTGIPCERIDRLTDMSGSNWSGSVGVG